MRLSAERELETIGKFLRTRTTVIQQRKNELGVIARSFWNSLKQRLSVSSMVTDLKDLIEKMFAYLRKAIMGTKSKNGGVPKIKVNPLKCNLRLCILIGCSKSSIPTFV